MMFVLVCLFAFASAQDGTVDCTKPENACKDRATLPLCDDTNSRNYIDPNSPCKCWICRPRDICFNCTKPTVECQPDQPPQRCFNCTDRACCPTCLARPCPTCPTLARDAPVCPPPTVGAAAPVPDCRICPNCTRPNPCANFDFTTCIRMEALPECDGTNAQPPDTCCPTCKPPVPCTQLQLERCKTSFPSLPVCASAAEFVFNPQTCCYPCRIADRQPTDPCTTATAAAELANIPDCQPNEIPIRIPSLCSYSCKEPGTGCKPELMGDLSTIPLCPPGIEPRWVGCNPTCRRPPPACSPECPTGKKCIPVPSMTAAGTFAPGCVDVDRCFTFWVSGMNTGAAPTDVFGTIVDRHCQNPMTALVDRCDIYKARLRASLTCTRTGETRTNEKGVVFIGVKCCFAADPTMGRRLLDSGSLLNGAVNNQGATGNLTFDNAPEKASASTITGFFGLTALLVMFY